MWRSTGFPSRWRRASAWPCWGPSGCGKTTLLNIVAGFLTPDAGDVRVADVSMAAMPPHRRDMGMVFQDYALFPHLSVVENVEFGLRMRRIAGPIRRRQAEAALELVGLAGYGRARRPAALGRAASACRGRPRAGHSAAPAAVRRAAVQSGCAAARQHADGNPDAADAHRHLRLVRDP
ncbi:MAG: ATP-binding cassette domain-containing protein [Pseudomonadota bacterium]